AQRVMTALLAARDRLGEMLADLGSSGLKSQYAIEGLIAELEAVTKTSSLENGDDSQLERVQNLGASSNRKDKDNDNDNDTGIKQVSAVQIGRASCRERG